MFVNQDSTYFHTDLSIHLGEQKGVIIPEGALLNKREVVKGYHMVCRRAERTNHIAAFTYDKRWDSTLGRTPRLLCRVAIGIRRSTDRQANFVIRGFARCHSAISNGLAYRSVIVKPCFFS